MIYSRDYAIKQENLKQDIPGTENRYVIGIDIGYSSVKGFSKTNRFIFPSFVKELKGSLLTTDKNDIILKDKLTNEMWIIGDNVLNGLSSDDTTIGGDEWYSRNRYMSKEYRVLIMAAIGLACGFADDSAQDKITIQTGLPPAYLSGDMNRIKKAFSGRMSFELCIGGSVSRDFDITIEPEFVEVMPQPMGTLYSVITDKEGNKTEDWMSFFSDNTIIFDGGFGTLDIYTIRGRQTAAHSSFNNLGMHEVMQRTSKVIYEKYGEDVPVTQLLSCMKDGQVVVCDEDLMKDEVVNILPILQESQKSVCDEAIAKLIDICKPIKDYKNLIVTGGTGALWHSAIADKFKNMQSLNVMKGNRNDKLDPVYSNVRGYYYFCVDKMRKE